MSVHTISTSTGVACLEATAAFKGLTAKERAYALALGKADWDGAKICLLQCSPESVPIFLMLQHVFCATPAEELVSAALAVGLTEDETQRAMIYCAAFYGNLGNYKSFGDTKFVPGLPQERFLAFLGAGKAGQGALEALWAECASRLYSLAPRQRQMGLGAAKGISTYFSANCEEANAPPPFVCRPAAPGPRLAID